MRIFGAIMIFLFSLFMLVECEKKDRNGIIMVDTMNTQFFEKELIIQDFMDVEYVPLETNKEFDNHRCIQAKEKKYTMVQNRNNDGDIFIYDRTGKALRKINRKGQGAEEYTNILGIILDENRNEMFVNDNHAKRILVYDLWGNFKRLLKYSVSEKSFYIDMLNYDEDNLICYDVFNEKFPFVLISKKDGSIVRSIEIYFKNKKMPMATRKDENNGLINWVNPGYYPTIISFENKWILLELSSDTIYQFLPDYSLIPLIVRTPFIDSMDPEIFLMLRLLSDRYIFMECVKNVFDFDKNEGFQRAFFMYDKQVNDFFRYRIYNGDYSTKEEIYLNLIRPVDRQILWQGLDAFQLVDAYEKGILNGKLKEIASKLDEDSNPVIMLIKYKK